MDKRAAIRLVQDTLESAFDKSKFAYLVSNMLDHIEAAPFIYRGNFIPDAYKPYISTLERIGKYKDREGNKIDLLIVQLKKETSLERARTMQRNFIAWYLNGSRGDILKDAALAAFVSPDTEDWRFSLVKMDYRLDTSGEKVKVKKELTPARRFSFLVGKNENSHTAQSCLLPVLEKKVQDPTLIEIEKAFDIETVTKEFFLKYRELFLHTKEELDRVVEKDPKIKADFEGKGVDTVNFAKKLLGQIIFLYFLQKKGWFGVGRDNGWGTGSKHFLRELFDKKRGDDKNFFNDILEPLFYDALSRDRSDIDHWNDQFKCKIPFLNGGLFDPIGNYDWVHTDILLPNKLFSNQTKTKEGDAGTGILDVFDRYNFTVKEDEPLEKEVAIDPELLGKSYEKFNAIRPDNFAEFKKALKSGRKGEENKFNKKFGVYYTPREIVHYMCQQSLINYLATELSDSHSSSTSRHSRESGNPVVSKEDIEALIHTGEQVSENEAIFLEKEQKIKKGEQKTTSIKSILPDSIRKNAKLIDDKLAEITVCDPAVGSGAFPVGMMSEIVKIRNVLTPFLSLRGAQATKQSQFDDNRTVYNFKRQCIEHSLYGVDIDPGAVEIAKLRLWLSLVVDEQDIKNIKPLPNLDYRIMQGNSLISEFMGISFDEDENKNLKQNIDDLGIEIKELVKQIKDKEKKLLRYYNKFKKQDQNISNKLEELKNRKNDLKKNQTQLIKKLNNPQNEDPEIIYIISEFQKKKNNFLNESNVTKKSQLKNEVDGLLVRIFETKLRTQKPDYFNRLRNIENKYSVIRNEKQRDKLIKQDKEKLNKEFGFDPELAEKQLKEFTSGQKIKPFFLWNLYFSEVFLSGAKSASGNKGGFDVVIANPPYGANISESDKKYLKKRYEHIVERIRNSFLYFLGLAYELINKQSIVSYIIPNEFLFQIYMTKARTYFLNHSQFIYAFNIGEDVFEAIVPTCLVAIKKETIDNYQIPVADFRNMTLNELDNRLQTGIFDNTSKNMVLNTVNSVFSFNLRNTILVNKLIEAYQPFDEFCDTVSNGISTSCDNVYIVNKTFSKKRNFETLYLKPCIRGGQFNRYFCPTDTGDQLLYITKDFDLKKGITIFKYLKEHRPLLIKKSVEKKKGNRPWHILFRSRDENLFQVPKIIFRQTGDSIIACIDERVNYYGIDSVNIAILKSTFIEQKRFLLGILNSKLTTFTYREISQEGGRVLAQVKPQRIRVLPIAMPEIEEQKPIENIVNRILDITKDEDYLQNPQKQAKVKSLEAEIDQLVYKLYGLTAKEIAIVEESMGR